MYSAATRATYAQLFKTAGVSLPSRLAGSLGAAARSHPIMAAAIAAALGAAGGAAQQRAVSHGREDGFQHGLSLGHHLGRMQ